MEDNELKSCLNDFGDNLDLWKEYIKVNFDLALNYSEGIYIASFLVMVEGGYFVYDNPDGQGHTADEAIANAIARKADKCLLLATLNREADIKKAFKELAASQKKTLTIKQSDFREILRGQVAYDVDINKVVVLDDVSGEPVISFLIPNY